MMNFFFAAALTVGILAGAWTYGSLSFGMLTWAAFIPWASFFAAGGKAEGLKKAYAANLSGILWGYVIVLIYGAMGNTTLGFSVGVAVGAAAMCIQARYIPWLSFIPGAFLGCAAYFAAKFDWKAVLLAITIGAILAYCSEWGALKLSASTVESAE